MNNMNNMNNMESLNTYYEAYAGTGNVAPDTDLNNMNNCVPWVAPWDEYSPLPCYPRVYTYSYPPQENKTERAFFYTELYPEIYIHINPGRG